MKKQFMLIVGLFVNPIFASQMPSATSSLDPYMILTQDQIAMLAITLAQAKYATQSINPPFSGMQLPLPTAAQLSTVSQSDLQNIQNLFNGNNQNNPSPLATTAANIRYNSVVFTAPQENNTNSLAVALLGLIEYNMYTTNADGTITLFSCSSTPVSPVQFSAINDYLNKNITPSTFDPFVHAALTLSVLASPAYLSSGPGGSIPVTLNNFTTAYTPIQFPAYSVIATWLGQAASTPLANSQALAQYVGTSVLPLPTSNLPTLSSTDFSALKTYIQQGTFTPQLTTNKALIAAINTYYTYTQNNANNQITQYPNSATLMNSYYPTNTVWPDYFPIFTMGQGRTLFITQAQAVYAGMQLALPTQGQLSPNLQNPGQTTLLQPFDLQYIQTLIGPNGNLSNYAPINGQSTTLGQDAFTLYTQCSPQALQSGSTCPTTFSTNPNDYNSLAIAILTLMQNNLYWTDNYNDIFFFFDPVNQVPLTTEQFASINNYIQNKTLPTYYDPAVQGALNAYWYQQQLGNLVGFQQNSATLSNSHPLNAMTQPNKGANGNPTSININTAPVLFPAYPLIAVWLAQAQYAGKQLPIDQSFSLYWVNNLIPTVANLEQSPLAQALFYLISGASITSSDQSSYSATINGQSFTFQDEDEFTVVTLVNQIVQTCSNSSCSVDFTQPNAQAALAYIGQMKYLGMLMPLATGQLPTLSQTEFEILVAYVQSNGQQQSGMSQKMSPGLVAGINIYNQYKLNNQNNQITAYPNANLILTNAFGTQATFSAPRPNRNVPW